MTLNFFIIVIGTICGLAIYNSTIIYLPFPLALYKKILNEPVGLADFKEFSSVEARGLQYILDYNEPDFEEVFMLNFNVSLEGFGTQGVIDLIPNGSNTPVTQENK